MVNRTVFKGIVRYIKCLGQHQLLIKSLPPAFPLHSLHSLVIAVTRQGQHARLAVLPIPDADLQCAKVLLFEL